MAHPFFGSRDLLSLELGHQTCLLNIPQMSDGFIAVEVIFMLPLLRKI